MNHSHHSHRSKGKKVSFSTVLILIFVFVLVIGGILLMLNRFKTNKDTQTKQTYNEESAALQAQKQELESEIAQLEGEISDAASNHGSAVLLYTEPNARLLDNVVPMMNDYGYHGSIAISDRYFPGNDGCLSVAQVNDLIDDGWDLCLSVSSDTDVAALYNRITDVGLPAPVALYCPDEACSKTQAKAALKLGINYAFEHHKKTENQVQDMEYFSASGSNESTSSSALSSAVKKSSCIAMTVGWHRDRELYEINNYSAMLSVTAQYASAGRLALTSTSAAIERFHMHEKDIEKAETERTKQKADLEAQLADIEEQIMIISNRK